MTWMDRLDAARARLDEVGYAGLTNEERAIIAYLDTATLNVVVPRGFDTGRRGA